MQGNPQDDPCQRCGQEVQLEWTGLTFPHLEDNQNAGSAEIHVPP